MAEPDPPTPGDSVLGAVRVASLPTATGWTLLFGTVACAMAAIVASSPAAAAVLIWLVVAATLVVALGAARSATPLGRVGLAATVGAQVLVAGGGTAFWYGGFRAAIAGEIAVPIGQVILAVCSVVWIASDPPIRALRSARGVLTFWACLLAVNIFVVLAAATTHNARNPTPIGFRLLLDVCILVSIVRLSRRSTFSNRAVGMLVYAFGLAAASAGVLLIELQSAGSGSALLPGATATTLALFPAAYLHARGTPDTHAANAAVNSAPLRTLGMAVVCTAVVALPAGSATVAGSGNRLRVGALLTLIFFITGWLDRVTRSLSRSADAAAEDSRRDGQTGLPNLIGLLRDVELGVASGIRSVVMIQIGGLDLVTATYGHSTQMALVRDAAERILRTVAPDEPVYRTDRRYFVVLCPGSRLPDLCEQLSDVLSEPFRESGFTVLVDPAIGAATGPVDLANIDDLLRDAESAVLRARRSGIPAAIFDAGARAEAAEQMRIAGDLRDAVNDGTLELEYQPIVDVTAGRPAAYEALLRWRNQGVLRPPAYFLETAERTGMIVEIGYWVLDAALAQLARVHAMRGDTDLAMSVNVSAQQLQAPGFGRRVLAALDARGIPPSTLWLELTETALISDVGNAQRALRPLAERGVRITLDDFGVGYSALSNLSNFPISILKIDKSFTEYLTASDLGSEKSRVIIASIVDMAFRLGIDVVVEGVETLELDGAVRATYARYAQGWLYGHPEHAETAFG